jgi:hypothetical protein
MSAARDWDRVFHDDLAADAAIERRLLVKEVIIVAIIALLVALREALL